MSNSETKGKNRVVFLVLSFLLSVFLLITSATFIISGFVFSEDSVITSLRAVNFHDDVYEHLLYSIGDTLIPTGVPQHIIDDAVTPDIVYTDINAHVVSVFGNNLPTLQRDLLAETLNNNIDNFLPEIGISRADVGYGVIDDIVEAVIDNYNDYVNHPFITQIARISNLFANHMRLLIAMGVVGILITMVILYLSNRNLKYLTFRYFAFSFGATALMLITAPLALRIWGGYQRLGIGPAFIHNFIVTHIERTVVSFLLTGSIFIALYLIFIIIFARSYRKQTAATQ